MVGAKTANSPLSLPFWDSQPISLIWLVRYHDSSTTSSLALLMDSCSTDARLGSQPSRLSPPLQALMASRKPGGHRLYCVLCALTPAPGEWDLGVLYLPHPHDYQVVRVLVNRAGNPPPITGRFLPYESHPTNTCKIKFQQQWLYNFWVDATGTPTSFFVRLLF